MKGPKKFPTNISGEQLCLIACSRVLNWSLWKNILTIHMSTIHNVETRVKGPQTENHLEDFSIFLFPSSIDIYPAEAHLCWERQRAAQQDKLQSTKFFHQSFHSEPSSHHNAVATVDIIRPDI